MFFDRLDFFFFGGFWGLLIAPFIAAFLALISYRLLGYGGEEKKSIGHVVLVVLLRFLLVIGVIALGFGLFLVSALPYGGGDARIGVVTRAAVVILPFWVALPIAQLSWPYGHVKDSSGAVFRGRLVSGGVLAVLSFLIVLRVTLMPMAKDPDRTAAVELRESAIVLCSKEVQDIDSEYKVDSIRLDANIVEKSSLRELLGARGLKFVEVKAGLLEGRKHRNEADVWGVRYVQGDDQSRLSFNEDVEFVKFDLSRNGDPLCSESMSSRFGVDSAPFAPGACLRITPEETSTASHAIKAIPIEGDKALIKWSLVELSSGKVIAGLTSADEPVNPARQMGGSELEWKRAKYGLVSCRQPYFSWVNALGGVSGSVNPKYALVNREIELEFGDLSSDLIRWRDFEGRGADVPSDAGLAKNAWGDAWKNAYQFAESKGVAGIGELLINHQSGELLSLQRPMFDGKAPASLYTAASRFGFVVALERQSNVYLVRYGFDGRVEWAGRIHVVNKLEDPESRLGLAGVEWEDDGVGIYFFKIMVNGLSSSKWLVRIPNSTIGIL